MNILLSSSLNSSLTSVAEVPMIDTAFDEIEDAFVPAMLENLAHLDDQFDGDEHYLNLNLNRWDDRKVKEYNQTKRKTGLERLALVDAPGSAGCAR